MEDHLLALSGSYGPLQLAVVGALLGLVALIAARVMQNLLPSGRPPVFEGIPFIGGILKFSKVGSTAGTPATFFGASWPELGAAVSDCRHATVQGLPYPCTLTMHIESKCIRFTHLHAPDTHRCPPHVCTGPLGVVE